MPSTVNTNTTNSTGTSVPLNMPASIVAGRLLLTIAVTGTSSPAMSGWTPITSVLSTSSVYILAVWAKTAVGGDSGTITQGGSNAVEATVYQIAGWSGALADVVATATAQGSGSATPNPPSRAITAARPTLWVECGSGGGSSLTASTNYSGIVTVVNATPFILGTAERQLYAASEDPGAFGGSVTFPVGGTVAIPGALTPAPTNRARLIRASHF